ncbi:MAG: hypothetical protein WB439_04405 [Acidobacteriaceae bacterium]
MLLSIISHPEMKTSLLYLRELPLVWFLVGCLFASVGLFLSSTSSPRNRFVLLRRIALAAGLLILVAYVTINLYSFCCFTFQQDEANILSISAAALRGLAVYNPPRSLDSSYSLMYGPFTFLIYWVVLIAGGAAHFWIIRGAVVLANLGLCAALYVLLRRFVSAFTAIALLTFPLSILLQHAEIALGVRSDIWIVLFTTLAIMCSFIEMELPAIILTGIMGGIVVGLKISAGPAILYPLLVLYRRFGLRAVVISFLTASAVTLAPFALPQFSLHNYISWLLFTRMEGVNASTLFSNALFALFLITPCLLMERFIRRFGLTFRQRLPELFLIALCLFLALLTSKAGSDPHYFWHIIPSVVVYLALVARDMKDIPTKEQAVPVYCIAVACALFACINIPRAYGHLRISLMRPDVGLAQQSINRYLEVYRDRSSIQMGYGSVDGDYRTLLRYILVYKGEPYTLEGNTGRFETRLLPFPVNVLNRMENCRNDVWLVPHAQKPFELWIFRNNLRKTFLENYSVDSSDGIYDAWTCNHAKTH